MMCSCQYYGHMHYKWSWYIAHKELLHCHSNQHDRHTHHEDQEAVTHFDLHTRYKTHQSSYKPRILQLNNLYNCWDHHSTHCNNYMTSTQLGWHEDQNKQYSSLHSRCMHYILHPDKIDK